MNVHPQATVCICNHEKCNDWTSNGTVTTDVPVTGGSTFMCYVGTAEDYSPQYCLRKETMCAYLLNDDGTEQVNDNDKDRYRLDKLQVGCYDPQKNNGTFANEACWEHSSVEFGDSLKHGKFCLCNGRQDELCNGDYWKNGPNGGAASHVLGLLVLVSALIVIMY